MLRKGELSAILVTREQRGRSHVLALPMRHRPTILDLPSDEACAVMQDVVDVARAIEAIEPPEGLAVWQNNGVAADQTIAHVQFHAAATLPGGGTERGEVEEISIAETERIGAPSSLGARRCRRIEVSPSKAAGPSIRHFLRVPTTYPVVSSDQPGGTDG